MILFSCHMATYDFSDWLEEELRRQEISASELARRARISKGIVSRILNRERFPSSDTLISIARGLRIDRITVFRAAGLLPPEQEEDPLLDRANYLLSQLPPEKQEEMIDYLEMLYDREQRKGENNHPRPRLAGSDG